MHCRMLPKKIDPRSGVALLPILPNGKIVLNCEFRHTTRCWELEMPRGGTLPGETLEEAAKREVLEETGCVIEQVRWLGEATGDSGFTGVILPIFTAKVVSQQKAKADSEEAIYQNVVLSILEIKQAFAKGYIELEIHGSLQRIYARDPFFSLCFDYF